MSREVLAPPLLRLGPNRCYRVNLIHDDFGGQVIQQGKQSQKESPKDQSYVEKDLYNEDDDDEEEGDFKLEEMPNAGYKLIMHVAPSFYGGLIGFKGSTKRRIENESRTTINVPSRGGKEDVIIKGQQRSGVLSARRKINLLLTSLRKRMRPTHYVCLPLYTTEIGEKFSKFKEEVLAANFPGIEESLFQNQDNLHLTLATCVLLDNEERAKGVEILESCREFLSDLKTPLEVKVSGLEILNDDPSAVRVLYGRVEAPDLQRFADRIQGPFIRSGFTFDEFQRENFLLHATMMNVSFRKKLNEKAENTFDAREILKKFSNYDFGTAQCSEIRLCVVGGKEQNNFVTGTMKF